MDQDIESLFVIPKNIAFLIFAWNEEEVIRGTIENIISVIKPGHAVFLIADNCSDNTALLAKNAGAEVFVRKTTQQNGKGEALSWFVEGYQGLLLDYDFLIIMDADSKIPQDFYEKLEGALGQDIQAGQCYLSPDEYQDNHLGSIIALSEIVEQKVFDRIKSALGFSVRLRGTGMVFRPRLLAALSPRISTNVEDVVLTLLAAEQNTKVQQLRSVTILDPKPTELPAASRQRARWFRSQWIAFWKYRSIVAKLLFRGPKGWSTLGSLFLKPRWLKLLILLATAFAFWGHPIIQWILFLVIFLEILLILIGIVLLPDRENFVRSLVYLPQFIWMWIRGIFLSFKKLPWLRVRKSASD